MSLRVTSLYGSAISPAICGEISGAPCTESTSTKLPTSTGVTEPLKFSKVLGLGKSIYFGAIFSISYPRTYALPGDTCIDNKSSVASPPSSVVAFVGYTPLFNPSSAASLISN